MLGKDPPPPPPPVNLSSKTAPAVLKLRTFSPNVYFPPQTPRSEISGPAPTGHYFFYGSLQDPGLLADILGLESCPQLRPAYLKGFKCSLWGFYPALLNGNQDDVVKGTVYMVQSVNHAERLAHYEGPSYQAIPCEMQYTDCEPHAPLQAHAFLFLGNSRDLSDGSFDLASWSEKRALMKGKV